MNGDELWEAFMAASEPGRELQIGADEWIVMTRSYRQEPGSDAMTFTVEMVRGGSEADPRVRFRDLLGGPQ